jgi:hypothetical protein
MPTQQLQEYSDEEMEPYQEGAEGMSIILAKLTIDQPASVYRHEGQETAYDRYPAAQKQDSEDRLSDQDEEEQVCNTSLHYKTLVTNISTEAPEGV